MNKAGFKKAWAFAGSRNFSVFVLVMSITYALVLAVFGAVVEGRWLDIMALLYPFKLLYALFFLNLILLGIKWVPAVVRRCRQADSMLEHEAVVHGSAVRCSGLRVDDLKQYLKRRCYRVFSAAGGATLLYARRGRYSPLGNLLFHAGFLLLLCGAVTNHIYRFEGTALLAEGREFTSSKKEYRAIVSSPTGELPYADFDVEKISADFWDGKLFFTRLEAQLLHRGGRDVVKLSDAARVGDAAVTISGYGYVPKFEAKDKTGKLADYGYVTLNIFAPGSEDSFQMEDYPHRIFVSFYPDYAVVDGKAVSKSMNPVNPAYSLRIFLGRTPVYTGVVKQGEWANYDGLSISFPSFSRSADFQIVRNPGHPLIWVAFIAMGLGLVWRLLFYRKEVVLWQDEAGQIWLSGRSDYYPRLHDGWLISLVEDFKGELA